jgi:dTDP-4-dehydrorhamnose 3,5-epimerase
MKFEATRLAGSYVVKINSFEDDRGWFARFYCKKEFEQIGHNKEWVQMNHSFTTSKGTIRGMHYQVAPYSEIKLVRCIAGAVLDVIVDLRPDSLTYMQYESIELSATNKHSIYIPEGFAHGFQALTDNCELIYLHSEYYNVAAEAGIRYNDSELNIAWPLPLTSISERDRTHPDFHPNNKEA